MIEFPLINPGIHLIGLFGKPATGVWLLESQSEAMLFEMPAYSSQDAISNPWRFLSVYLDQQKLRLKGISASHAHSEKFASYKEFHDIFPTVPIIVHNSFFPETNIAYDIQPEQINNYELPTASMVLDKVPIYCFKQEMLTFTLGGEPVYLIHAPKHSWSDLMLIFRGTMISGDWWWGKGDPNWFKIPKIVINQSILTLKNFPKTNNYKIHSVFSSNGNEFRRNVDFGKLLDETKI